MYGNTYIRRGVDHERAEAGRAREARRADILAMQRRLGLSDREMRDLSQIALDLQRPLSELVRELGKVREGSR